MKLDLYVELVRRLHENEYSDEEIKRILIMVEKIQSERIELKLRAIENLIREEAKNKVRFMSSLEALNNEKKALPMAKVICCRELRENMNSHADYTHTLVLETMNEIEDSKAEPTADVLCTPEYIGRFDKLVAAAHAMIKVEDTRANAMARILCDRYMIIGPTERFSKAIHLINTATCDDFIDDLASDLIDGALSMIESSNTNGKSFEAMQERLILSYLNEGIQDVTPETDLARNISQNVRELLLKQH